MCQRMSTQVVADEKVTQSRQHIAQTMHNFALIYALFMARRTQYFWRCFGMCGCRQRSRLSHTKKSIPF